MRIDQLTVELRARNPWEAFDLGFSLVRHTGANLYLAFGLSYLSFVVSVNLVTWGHPTVAMLIVWWLKPVFDRIALYVVSQAVFGATPSWRATIKDLRKIPRTGLLHSLTLGRLDFARSYHLPVMQLESQIGKARRERIAVLDRTARSPAVWLTIVLIHFVYVLLFGLDGLLKMISPEGVQFNLQLGAYFGRGGFEPSLASQYLFNGALALIESLLEPLYVAAGFSLYLSRRTVLEGWDLEVAFKRMSARVEAAGTLAAKVAMMVMLSATVLHGIAGNEAWAQPAAREAPAAEKKMIDEILQGPEFNQYEEQTVWRRKHPLKEAEAPRMSGGWVTFARFMAEALRAVAWAMAICFVGWLVYYLSQRLGWFKGLIGQRTVYKPDVLFGLDLRAESLPDNIPEAARAMLAHGNLRAALSLLYRGALRVLIHERELDVREGDTEGDCVRRVSRTAPGDLAEYFRRLVNTWGLLAYARRAPDAVLAQGLVDDWARHFVPSAPQREPAAA